MSRRLAYLIGNQQYQPDSGFSSLQGPRNDIEVLSRLLSDPERGNFIIKTFLDEPSHDVLPVIECALNEASAEDLILIYYSGHGTTDRSGQLCLVTSNTKKKSIVSTSISTHQIKELVDQSDCGQTILILDCCYSGAIEGDFRDDFDQEFRNIGDASGFYIITASTALQRAREVARNKNGLVMGRFTAQVVEGIESGAADLNRTGRIFLADIRQYLIRNMTGQTPQFFDRRASGNPLISLSPGTSVPLIDQNILSELESQQWTRRQGAVVALADMAAESTGQLRLTIRTIIRNHLNNERDFSVKRSCELALSALENNNSSTSTLNQVSSVNNTELTKLYSQVESKDKKLEVGASKWRIFFARLALIVSPIFLLVQFMNYSDRLRFSQTTADNTDVRNIILLGAACVLAHIRIVLFKRVVSLLKVWFSVIYIFECFILAFFMLTFAFK